MLTLILLVAAFILFALAAFYQPSPSPRISFGWLGAACATLALLLGQHWPK